MGRSANREPDTGAPDDPSDVVVTIEAEDVHDFKDRLGEITAPTLVVAGDQDPFYPAALFRDTGRRHPQRYSRPVRRGGPRALGQALQAGRARVPAGSLMLGDPKNRSTSNVPSKTTSAGRISMSI